MTHQQLGNWVYRSFLLQNTIDGIHVQVLQPWLVDDGNKTHTDTVLRAVVVRRTTTSITHVFVF